MSPTASRKGESIRGERITYGFGKVHVSREGPMYRLSLGLNGEAYVAKRWRRSTGGLQVGGAASAEPDHLVAASAVGTGGKHRDTGREHYGAHRVFTGVLERDATVRVKVPHDAE